MTVTSENDAFFNNYSGGATATGGYVNKVYFGQSAPKQTRMKRSGEVINIPTDRTLSITEAKRLYLTDEALRNKWNTTLRKNGIDADPIKARAIWDLAVDGASDWYATSNGQQKITPEQYLGWYAGGKAGGGSGGGAGGGRTRQIYQVTEDEIDADISAIAFKTLGRELQDADKSADWYKDLVKGINKLYSKGIVTTTKEVKNPKTGKVENVVTQTPKFSKEQITEKITSAVEAADPVSLQRKQDLDFANWAFNKMGGGR